MSGDLKSGEMEVYFSPLLLKREMVFHNRIIGNFMVYKDRLETNLLQLFAHPQNS